LSRAQANRLRAQLEDAEKELGRVVGEAGSAMAGLEAENTGLRRRVLELEAVLARQAAGNAGGRRPADTLDSTPVPPFTAAGTDSGPAAEEQIASLRRRVVSLESELTEGVALLDALESTLEASLASGANAGGLDAGEDRAAQISGFEDGNTEKLLLSAGIAALQRRIGEAAVELAETRACLVGAAPMEVLARLDDLCVRLSNLQR
jgi:hypothetical protein